MDNPSRYLDTLIREFMRLPGIGARSASRLAFHLLKMRGEEVESMTRAMLELKRNIVTCGVCGGISDGEVCSICSDPGRDGRLLCVVESARDVLTLEATGGFLGYYHVLMGVISPLDGIGPEELNISRLAERCAGLDEVILALSPTIEGDATALYLARMLEPAGVRISRIAHGLPVGSDLEFADSATIIKSLEGRVRMC